MSESGIAVANRRISETKSKRQAPDRFAQVDRTMSALAKIVLDDHRDIIRMRKAMTQSGAEEIISRHNAKKKVANKPQLQWHGHYEDINDDDIDDVIIHRGEKTNESGKKCTAPYVAVNGWRTKQSDDALRRLWREQYPTKQDRRNYPYSLFRYTYGDRFEVDPNYYDKPKQTMINRINKSGYRRVPTLTPFTFFTKNIFSPIAQAILKDANIKYDVAIVGKAQADMFNAKIKDPSKGDKDLQIAAVNNLYNKANDLSTNQEVINDVATYLGTYIPEVLKYISEE